MIYKNDRSNTDNNILAITFDAVGTLIVPHPSVGEIYARELGRMGYSLSPKLLQQRFIDAFTRFKKDHPEVLLDKKSWHTIVADTLLGLTGGDDFSRQFEVLWHAFTRHEYWRLLQGVEATLKRLQGEGLRLFVLSNNDERLHTIIDGLRIGGYFEDVFVSAELGAEKPSPRIFELVQARIKVAPRNILHVGDNPVEDVQGALDAGWRAALVGPRAETSESAGKFIQAVSIHELFFEE